MSPMLRNVVIIGGGFSGVAVAWQLLSQLKGSVCVHLVNKGALGRGLAYGTPSPHHLLNVPAARMGISAHDESGFLSYLQRLGLPFGAGDFVPRSLYAAYLQWALGEASAVAHGAGVSLQTHDTVATELQPDGQGRYRVHLQSAHAAPVHLVADSVVLALGNFASIPPPVQPDLDWGAPGLYASSWGQRVLAPSDIFAPVLLLGSGLTALDVLLQLRHEGHRGQVTMLSRRGLLAQAHRRQETPPPKGLVPADAMQEEYKVRGMLRSLRNMVASAHANGHDWRDVIGGLRAATPRLWQQLDTAEQQRFLRHLAPYWDTHRHRHASQLADIVAHERSQNKLCVMAGRLQSLERDGQLWSAGVQQRGAARVSKLLAHAVINCTGPSTGICRANDLLLKGLLHAGRLKPDALGLGLEVGPEYLLLDAAGTPQPGLRYVGPLLRAGLWEATAVPELRQHAAGVANAVVAGLQRGTDTDMGERLTTAHI